MAKKKTNQRTFYVPALNGSVKASTNKEASEKAQKKLSKEKK